MTRTIAFIIFLWLGNLKGFSQNEEKRVLTLNDCIEIAIKNNLDLKVNRLQEESSGLFYKQSKNDMLPTLNMNYNLGANNGRSIDPFTNSYINQELTFSNAGLFLDLNVFNGFKLKNEVKQNSFNMKALEMKTEETRQNLTLEVTLRYIQILNNRDLIELAKSNLETTETQLKRLELNYLEGSGNPVDYTDMQGQYASDQTNIINAEIRMKSAVINLVKLLNLDLDSGNVFESIVGFIGVEKYKYSSMEVYNDALENLATFKSKQFKIDAAESGVKVARSNFYPEVSLFGQLNTNYSSLANSFNETGSSIISTGDYVSIDNQDYNVLRNQPQFESTEINYRQQFENNLNSVAGISVRIPIFNGFRGKNSVALQKIQVKENKVEMERTKFDFKQSIKEAYNDMESAYNRYHILLDQVNAYEESFRVNEVRFNNGVSNIVDYITSKNNMDTSRLNLNITKYEYLLRVKILDYYRGI